MTESEAKKKKNVFPNQLKKIYLLNICQIYQSKVTKALTIYELFKVLFNFSSGYYSLFYIT